MEIQKESLSKEKAFVLLSIRIFGLRIYEGVSCFA